MSSGDAPTSTAGTTGDVTGDVPGDATSTGDGSSTGDDTDTGGSSGATTAMPVDCDIVEFPDPLVEAAVRGMLALPVGPISGEQMATLEHLAVGTANCLVQNLEGLQCATGLTYLVLNGADGQGGDFLAPLAGLVQLETLRLSGGAYGELGHIAGLTQLTRLTLSGIGLVDLSPLAGMVMLDNLDLGSNAILDLAPIAGLTTLRALTLRANPVTDLTPLAGLTALERLDISATPVTDLGPVAGLTAMLDFLATASEVEDLGPLAGLSQLQGLYLDSTPVSDLAPLAGLPILYFSAAGCSISVIDPIASWPTPIQIDLSNNDIVELDGLLATDWLVVEPFCAEVHLTGNPLSPAALGVVSQVCSDTKVGIFADGATCEGHLLCVMP